MLSNFAATLAVIAFGTLTGMSDFPDLQTQEVQGMAVMIFMFACLVGAAFPEGAWRRALALGLTVPFAHWVSHKTGQVLPYPLPDLATAFLAVVPAFVGTYLGVGLRRAYGAHGEKHPRA
jgi:hypothetical protein